jgi:hypothetical protein
MDPKKGIKSTDWILDFWKLFFKFYFLKIKKSFSKILI